MWPWSAQQGEWPWSEGYEGWPRNEHYERCAVGAAVLLLGTERGKRMLARASAWDFYGDMHGWYWARLRRGTAFTVEAAREFRERFNAPLAPFVAGCVESAWWWHADFYLDAVLDLARKRDAILSAAWKLRMAMEDGDAAH